MCWRIRGSVETAERPLLQRPKGSNGSRPVVASVGFAAPERQDAAESRLGILVRWRPKRSLRDSLKPCETSSRRLLGFRDRKFPLKLLDDEGSLVGVWNKLVRDRVQIVHRTA